MRISLFLFITLFLFSCKEKKKENTASSKNIVQYAKHLSITESKNGTKIKITSPETGKTEQSWFIPKQIVKAPNQLKDIPFKRLTVLSSTHVGMLSKLNAIDRIVGITDSKYVFNRNLLQSVKEGKVLEVGEEGQIPVESLLKSKSQAIIYSGFGKEFPHEGQLRSTGINCIVNYDWRETHPLGKAEWILLFGYLTGKEKEAKAYFDKIEKAYLDLKTKAQKVQKKPTVLSGNLAGETWFAPAGESFNAVLFSDAHVNYRYANSDGTGSLALSMERVLSDNIDTEHWINPGFPTKEKLFGFQAKLKFLGPVLKNKIFDYSQSGNRYWEMSAIEPQKVLSDYLSIFHPDEFPNQNLYFYEEVK